MAPIPETRAKAPTAPARKSCRSVPVRPQDQPRDTVTLGHGVELFQLRSRVAPTPQPDRHFAHQPLRPQNLTSAQTWKPGAAGTSPSQANQRINEDYHRLNRSMQRYLSGDRSLEKLPTMPDWMAFGKYASREAGEQIRNLENLQKAGSGDLKASGDLSRDGFNLDAMGQAFSMGKDTVIETATDVYGLPAPRLLNAAQHGVDKLNKLSSALVKGNTEIHRNIAPAYDLFLTGEASGEGGLKKLEQAGYFPGSTKDPQGFVTEAFESYQEARQLGMSAQRTKDSNLKAELLEDRRKLMERGNLMLGIQEQMEILQQPAIYGDADVQSALRSVRGQMSLTDANGKHKVGSPHKDWTDFPSRMGLREVTAEHPEAIAVRDPQGRTHHYLPDPSQAGTIVEYFSRHSKGDEASQALARNLILQQPRPTVEQPQSFTGTLTDDVARKTEWLKDKAGSLLNLVL